MKKEIFDYDKLRGRIKECLGTEREFAKQLGITPQALCNRLNNKTDFTPTEMLMSKNILNFDSKSIGTYFFTQKVQKNEQKSA